MADIRNRTPFYGAVPTSKLNADHVFMSDGSTLQEQADKTFELIEEITLTEDVAVIERTFTKEYSDIIIKAITTPATVAQNVRIDSNNTIVAYIRNFVLTTAGHAVATIFSNHNTLIGTGYANAGSNISAFTTTTNIYNAFNVNFGTIKDLTITDITSGGAIPAGSVISIYGLPA